MPLTAAEDDAPVVVRHQGDVQARDDDLWKDILDRRDREVALAPQSLTIISNDDITTSPAPQLVEHLRYEAGVDVYQVRHAQYSVGIRGFTGLTGQRTLLRVDGRQFGFSSLGVQMWHAIHPTDITRVELLKGPSSVTYGANAFGGVIDIKTRTVGDIQELHVLNQVGDYGYREADATVLMPLGKNRQWYAKASMGGSWREDLPATTGREQPIGTPSRTEQTRDDDLASTRAKFRLGRHLGNGFQLEAEAIVNQTDEWEVVEDFTIGSNRATIDEWTAGLRLRSPWGGLRWLHTDHESTYSNQKTVYKPLEDFRYSQAALEEKRDRVIGTLREHLGPHHLTGAIEYEHWESDSNLWSGSTLVEDRSTWRTRTTNNLGISAEDQWKWDPDWMLSAGLRFDHHDRFGEHWSPRVALNWLPGDHEFFRLSYSNGYRLPGVLETYFDQFFFAVSDDLDVETVDSIDATWRREWPDAGFTFQIDAFHNQADDILWYRPLSNDTMRANYLNWLATVPGQLPVVSVPPGPFFEYRNLDNTLTGYGAEIQAAWQTPLHGWKIWGNTTLQDYSYEDDIIYSNPGFTDPTSGTTIFAFDWNLGDDVNTPPDVKANLGIDYERGGWRAGTVVRYVGERTGFSFGSTFFQRGDGLGKQTIDDYVAVDFGFGYDFGHEGSRRRLVKLDVINAFDDRHVEATPTTSQALIDDEENQRVSTVVRQIVATVLIEF